MHEAIHCLANDSLHRSYLSLQLHSLFKSSRALRQLPCKIYELAIISISLQEKCKSERNFANAHGGRNTIDLIDMREQHTLQIVMPDIIALRSDEKTPGPFWVFLKIQILPFLTALGTCSFSTTNMQQM